MSAFHDFLSKFLPLINYIAGLGIAGVGGWYLLFSNHTRLFDWFGPSSLIVLALVMVSSDLKFHGVRRLFKLLDYYLGRGLYYFYIAMFLHLLAFRYTAINYVSDCPKADCSFLYTLYIDACQIGAWALLGFGATLIVVHFISSDKRISAHPGSNKGGDVENQGDNTNSGSENNSDYVNPTPKVTSTDL
mmetsp:Transcript_82854/g.115091  ORF Transcript_82854/g.115091 Transcript_82854/m.115091 type:complete len:189 (+) Transcript_82854:63-629(+)